MRAGVGLQLPLTVEVHSASGERHRGAGIACGKREQVAVRCRRDVTGFGRLERTIAAAREAIAPCSSDVVLQVPVARNGPVPIGFCPVERQPQMSSVGAGVAA